MKAYQINIVEENATHEIDTILAKDYEQAIEILKWDSRFIGVNKDIEVAPFIKLIQIQ